MDDQLASYLGDNATPENQRQLLAAYELLNKVGVLGHQTDVERILSTADDFETHTNIQDLFSLLSEYVSSTVLQFGVVISDDVPLGVLNLLLEGLTTLSIYGDPERIIDICEMDEPYDNKLLQMLDEVTTMQWFDFAAYINQVNESFITQVLRVSGENLPPEDERKDVSVTRERVRRFLSHYPDTLAHRELRGGLSLETSLEIIIKNTHDDLGELEKKPFELTKEILGLVLLSDVAEEDIDETVRDVVDDYAEDINIVTKATSVLTDMIAEVSREKA